MNRPYRHTFEGTEASVESKMLLFCAESILLTIRSLKPFSEIFFKIDQGNFCHASSDAAKTYETAGLKL
jgi:hypothetical protein